MKRTPSENMQAMYAAKKNDTISKISSAIQEIEDDNRIVTKKELISLTGLSSGTFSKPYVLELLKERKVCQFRDRRKIIDEKREKLSSEILNDLEIENRKLSSAIDRLSHRNSILEKRLKDVTDEYEELKTKHAVLLGKYQVLLEKLDILGEKLDPKLYN